MISNSYAEVNNLPSQEIRNIVKEVKSLADTSGRGEPRIAAFDADGTLWDMDVGETFFQYQIDNCSLPALDSAKISDPWKHYFGLKKISPPQAYLWLAQINAGQELSTVRAWAEDCYQKFPPPFLKTTTELIRAFLEEDFDVYIVSASIQWAVEPGARRLGIPQENVLGVKTRVDKQGVVTLEQEGPVTWKEGKTEALLQATGGARPLFACGNTNGDLPLLESSRGLRLAISTQNQESHLFQTEQELQKHARDQGWLTHQCRPLDTKK